MGNTQARMSRRSASMRKETIKAVANVTAQKVNKAQEQILTQFKNDKTALITPQSVAMALSVCETAKTQIQREGAVLSKADLIAIIVALSSNSGGCDLGSLQGLTIPELNTLIRGRIYDPARYMKLGDTPTSAGLLSIKN